MNAYAIYDTATGAILGVMTSPSAPSNLDAGRSYLLVPEGTIVGYQTHRVADPGADDASLAPYTVTLGDYRFVKSQQAAQYFATLFLAPAGFTSAGALYQIDPSSQSDIAAMGSLASASLANPTLVPWPAGFYWIAADNSHNAMTAAQMLGFAASVAGYVSACVLRLRAIKDAIAAAPGQATLAAIDVTAGYPAASA